MGKLLANFGKNLKGYIDHIMKVSFGELVFHFFELLILILIALFIYIPMGLVQDICLNFLRLILTNISNTVSDVFNLTFSIIDAIIALFVFIYLFNKRYEDLKNEEKKEKKDDTKEKTKKNDLIDLPKMKDE